MTMTRPPRRKHAALGARWVTAGLAASGTLGITSYLEFQHVASASSVTSVAVGDPNSWPGAVALPTVPAPPAPTVKIVTAPGKKKKAVTSTAAPGGPASTTRPTVTSPPNTQAPKRTSTNATTRSSPG